MADITKASVRGKLEPRAEPYWRQADTGLYVGFRKNRTGLGVWVARLQEGTRKRQKKLGAVTPGYTFAKAAEDARAWAHRQQQGVTDDVTVWDVCEAYLANLAIEKRDTPARVKATEKRLERTVKAHSLGAVPMARLNSQAVLAWRNERSEQAAHQGTVNRDLVALKAALSWGYRHNMAASDDAWARVDAFKVQYKARRYLTPEERQRLIKAASPEVANVIKAVLYTGTRPGMGLLGATVEQFHKPENGHPGQFHSTTRKGNGGLRSYYCELTPEASAFFTELCRNKLPKAPLFTMADGRPWRWDKVFRDHFLLAVGFAGLPPDTVPYDLRHTVMSDWLTAGISPHTVAKWAGTSLAMIDKTYGHLVPNSEIHKLAAFNATGE